MKLNQLMFPLIGTEIKPDIEINSIQFQSSLVQKGDIYIAIRGFTNDGHKYIGEAISKGASAIVGEEDLLSLPVPYFRVADSREALGRLATSFYNFPAKKHRMIGITGTNGKTTTAYMVKYILQYAEKSCSLISTVSNYINGQELVSTATTPSSLELNKLLSLSNDESVVMEVSSHGLDQKRVEGIEFEVGLFTNLTHDHLDYHKDLNEYFETKSKLFDCLGSAGAAIINSRCPWGLKMIERLRCREIPVYTFGHQATDDLQLLTFNEQLDSDFIIQEKGKDEIWNIKLSMPGAYNRENAMAAILLARRMGVGMKLICEAIETFPGVPGRYEVYQHHSGISFVVDYAHTPDGMENFLETVKRRENKKLIHIFGFRGNKDVSKRKQMMDISSFYCDEIILTFDDLNGVSAKKMKTELNELAVKWGKGKARIITDRTSAIEYAWEHADKNSCIIITGKGPESYKEDFSLPTDTDADTIKYLFTKKVKFIER